MALEFTAQMIILRQHPRHDQHTRGETTQAIQARQREQPASDPARQVHAWDQDRCCLVSKKVPLWDQEARSDPARRCMVRIKKVLLYG
jgi:hypothetical protein